MFGFIRSALFPWFLIILAVVMMGAGRKNGVEFAALRDHGVTTVAEITELEWRRQKNSNSESGHVARIQFTTEDGQKVRETVSISEDLNRQLRAREIPWNMDINYLPEDPSTLRRADDSDQSDSQKDMARYILLAGIGTLVLRYFLVKK